MIITINPLEMDNLEHRILLRALLTSNKLCLAWEKDVFFNVFEHQIKLTHTLFLKALTDEQAHYHVIANEEMGRGLNGVVSEIACTFSFINEDAMEYAITEPLIVKVMLKELPNMSNQAHVIRKRVVSRLMKQVDTEYKLSQKASHLHVERPVVYDLSAYLVMRKMPGFTLHSFLTRLYSSSKTSSFWHLRFMLTHALLKAFQSQVVAHDLTHLDLKPDNMLIDTGNLSLLSDGTSVIPECVELNIIDYGLSKNFGDESYLSNQRRDYVSSAELPYKVIFHDEKADLKAMGIILKIIWGFGDNFETVDLSDKTVLEEKYQAVFANRSAGFSLEIFTSICTVITKMTCEALSERWSLNEIMAAFTSMSAPFNEALQGQLEKVKQRVASNRNLLNQTNDKGLSLLHKAVILRNSKILQFLVDEGADLNQVTPAAAKDNAGIKYPNMTAIEIAVAQTQYADAVLLLNKGANSPRAISGQSHLIHIAASKGDLGTVKKLIEGDEGLVNAIGRYNETPLLWAAAKGHYKTVSFLIAKGGDITLVTQLPTTHEKYETNHHCSPLDLAIKGGHTQTASLLKQAHCEADKSAGLKARTLECAPLPPSKRNKTIEHSYMTRSINTNSFFKKGEESRAVNNVIKTFESTGKLQL